MPVRTRLLHKLLEGPSQWETVLLYDHIESEFENLLTEVSGTAPQKPQVFTGHKKKEFSLSQVLAFLEISLSSSLSGDAPLDSLWSS